MKYDPKLPPLDPTRFVLINSKDGLYWRLRRGKGSGTAALNKVVGANAALTRISSPAGALLRRTLNPFLTNMDCGRLTVKISAQIRKGLAAETWPDYGLLRDLDFQPGQPFGGVLHVQAVPVQEGDLAGVRIPIPAGGAVIRKNTIVSEYRFVLVMIVGDPVEDANLATFMAESPLYKMGKAYADCELSLAKPAAGIPWLLCLRVMTYEGKDIAVHGRHAGMKVLGWG